MISRAPGRWRSSSSKTCQQWWQLARRICGSRRVVGRTRRHEPRNCMESSNKLADLVKRQEKIVEGDTRYRPGDPLTKLNRGTTAGVRYCSAAFPSKNSMTSPRLAGEMLRRARQHPNSIPPFRMPISNSSGSCMQCAKVSKNTSVAAGDRRPGGGGASTCLDAASVPSA